MLESQQRNVSDPRMGDPRMMGHAHHQHSHSGSLGRVYVSASPVPSREQIGGPPPGPPQSQTPVYPRYATPAPRDVSQHHYEMQMRVDRDRHQEYRAAELREQEAQRMREIQQREQELLRMRDMHPTADLRDMREYGRPGPADYAHQPGEFRGELRGAPPPPPQQQQQQQPQDPRSVDLNLRRQLRPPDYPPGPERPRY